MKEFLSLREFCLLKDPFDPTRPAHDNCPLSQQILSSAEDIVIRYDIAKKSWERWGDDGPPIGSKVLTLVPGHGGGPFCTRKLSGIFERDDKFFIITQKTGSNKFSESLVNRSYWWLEIATPDCIIQDLKDKCRWVRHAVEFLEEKENENDKKLRDE